jgi:hypothetical protein
MRDCGGRKQVDGQSTHENFNLAAVPVFPAQVVRVYIPHTSSTFLRSRLVCKVEQDSRYRFVYLPCTICFPLMLAKSTAFLSSTAMSQGPDVKPYLPEQFFDGYGIDDFLKMFQDFME